MRMSDQAFNRLSVLKKLRLAEPVSRTVLAHISGLNGGTITAIVRDLVERGLVLEERVSSVNRGRPKVNLRINPEGAFAVGATMTDDGRLLAEIVDLRGKAVASHDAPFIGTGDLENLAAQFAAVIGGAIDQSGLARGRIAQVGIGLPAIIDARSGVIEFFETFTREPFPFAAAVERRLGIPVRIDNNNNLLARSEHWFGDGNGVDDFTLVMIDLGIGAARYQAGQLLIGSHGIEAELGHTKIVPEGGEPCHCGGAGCLQAYASMSAIVFQAADLAGESRPEIFDLRDRFLDLAARARAGEVAIAALFERAARYLGRGLANHVNMQDPDRILILTRSPELIPLLSGPFFAALERDTLPVLRDPSRVSFKAMNDTSYARGAAAMVFEQLYESD